MLAALPSPPLEESEWPCTKFQRRWRTKQREAVKATDASVDPDPNLGKTSPSALKKKEQI